MNCNNCDPLTFNNTVITSEDLMSSESSGDTVEVTELKQPRRDSFLQLVSLQKASGCWLLEPHLAAVLGKTSEEVESPKPAAVKEEVWATILALIWLHGLKLDVQDEWQLLAMKAASWIRAQKAPCVTECVEAGNALLGCEVQKDSLGI
ncbi:von Willebrand factor A domain-containing protein 5A-like [Scomber japonicus]|uniref:von Willebrand factor A domain-containing protein 5A-like n=1 Tax=Scomber japonicus TaxID=13676 RepID=UPI0023064F0A|nr:von Willebrand factor A domain-containing protein 5A-like [Scomber japonicus]